MFRTGSASVAIADVKELADAATLEKDPTVVNDHYDRVTSQLKKAHYLQGTVPDGETDDLGFPGFERDETNGWVFGNHPGQTPSQAQQFKDMLIAHKHCF
jgi:hypothetical protein